MMKDTFIEVLFESDAWATRLALKSCCELSQVQFKQQLGLGHGSIEQTATHLVQALFYFTARLNRQRPNRAADWPRRALTPEEMLAVFEAANDAFQQALARTVEVHDMDDVLNWTDTDEGPVDPSNQVAYAVALAQMIDHSLHHRAQISDMLRLVGMQPKIEGHPFEWDEYVRGAE